MSAAIATRARVPLVRALAAALAFACGTAAAQSHDHHEHASLATTPDTGAVAAAIDPHAAHPTHPASAPVGASGGHGHHAASATGNVAAAGSHDGHAMPTLAGASGHATQGGHDAMPHAAPAHVHAGHPASASFPAPDPVRHGAVGMNGSVPPPAAPVDPHAGHANHAALPGDDATPTDPHARHGIHAQGAPDGQARDAHTAHGHAGAVGSSQPREPIPALTDADRAAAFPHLHHGHAHGDGVHSLVRFNRFEAWDADPGTGQAWEGNAWIGSDIRRLWLRSEGEREHGRTHAADLEMLYGHGISPWWDVVAGLRQDFAPGPSRTWAAIGVQGMAPYKFEVSATAYLGEGGHSAFSAEVEYELLLTNRLVLQPLVEVDVHGRADPQRGTGTGLSTVEAGLRLRYEITRRFAPYLGVVHERALGDTADLRRQAGEELRDTRWVAGVRWWF